MPKIRLLEDALISKIAAGEVIERPASVVKELVENSLDANSKTISVSIEEGGCKKIAVADDGEGMDEEDCKRSIGRHATSKITEYNDLFNISTLGFRGEALASIAAISDLTITSRMRNSNEGTLVKIDRGVIINVSKTGAPPGTEICIERIFAHTPARRKYLKSPTAEAAMVAEVMTRFALLNYTKQFQLFHNQQCIINASQTNEWKERIAEIYGNNVAQGLLPIYYKNEQYTIEGFISKPELTRADKRYQQLYVNNRWVKNKIVSDAVQNAYGRLLFHDRYPTFVLHVQLPCKKLDVNVHPTKREIRFLDEQGIYDAVSVAVSTTLKAYDLTPSTTITINPFPKQEVPFMPDKSVQSTLPKTREKIEEYPFAIKGSIHNCFWIIEDKDGLMLVDQHAADERSNYEKLVEQYSSGGIETQQMLEPVSVTLPAQDVLLLSQNINVLEKFGFFVEPFGNNTVIIRSSPVIMGRQQTQELLIDLITELSHVDISRIENFKDNILARMACRKSVMKGDVVETHEMYKIMKRLFATKEPYTCPHGRPTMIKLSTPELEKKFKRCG